jgi:hypothetical protein
MLGGHRWSDTPLSAMSADVCRGRQLDEQPAPMRATLGVMILAAIVIGLLTAYYFGVQAGIWAAAGTVALMVAALIPGWATYAYVALGVGVAAIVYTGPKLRRPGSQSGFIGLGREMAKRYTDRLFSNKRR